MPSIKTRIHPKKIIRYIYTHTYTYTHTHTHTHIYTQKWMTKSVQLKFIYDRGKTENKLISKVWDSFTKLQLSHMMKYNMAIKNYIALKC